MNKVRRYAISMNFAKCHINNKGDFVEFTDFESERALRIDAEKKLHELQDAIALRTQRQVSMGNNSNDYQIKYSLIFPKQGLMDEILISNIQESRKRGEAK